MTIDASLVGRSWPGGNLLITRSRLRLFAKATGQTDPVFVDIEAALAAGHPDLPVPPTFYLGVELEVPDPIAYLVDLGIDMRAVLHGEQSFEYHATAHAGDELSSSSRLTDVFEKKGGALTFLLTETHITNQKEEKIVTMRSTIIVRQLTGVVS